MYIFVNSEKKMNLKELHFSLNKNIINLVVLHDVWNTCWAYLQELKP